MRKHLFNHLLSSSSTLTQSHIVQYVRNQNSIPNLILQKYFFSSVLYFLYEVICTRINRKLSFF